MTFEKKFETLKKSLVKADVNGIEFHAVGLNRVYTNVTFG